MCVTITVVIARLFIVQVTVVCDGFIFASFVCLQFTLFSTVAHKYHGKLIFKTSKIKIW